MIDTGLTAGGAFRALKAKARADGLDLSDVLWILHTHCHWDHINADGAVLSSCNARIAAGEEDAPFIENREKNFSGGVRGFGDLTPEIFPYPSSWVRLLMWVSWGSQPALRVDRSLADGETVDMGRKIEVLSLPGHTAGHMGYFVPDAGVAVLGDLIDFENAQGLDLNNPRKDVSRRVFPDIPFSMQAMTMMLTLTVLLAMEGAGEAERTENSGRPAWVRGPG